MNKFFLLSALLALVSGARAEVITLTPNAAGTGGGLVGGSSTITGTCGSGQFLYNNSGILGCQAVSGGITGPGTTVSGDLVTWNSATGAAIADSGFNISGGTITGPTSASLTLLGSSGHGMTFGSNGGASWTIPYNGTNLYPSADNTSSFGISTNRISSGFFVNLGSATTGISSVYLQGSSTGTDLISSGNTSTSNRTISTPAGTANDTLALLGAGQTFSGAIGHSGTAQFSGAGPASGPSANTTWIQGGTTAPTLGSNAGIIAIGGNYTPGALANGQAEISTTTTAGLQLQGYTATSVYSYTGGMIAQFTTNGLSFRYGLYNMTSTHILDSVTAPTTPVNAALTYQNGTAAIVFTATGGTTTISLTMPAH